MQTARHMVERRHAQRFRCQRIGILALVCVCACSFNLSVFGQEISWIVPDDGGTPRDPKRIEQQGPREFLIRSSFEEGGDSVLCHAVSRVELICRNAGDRPVGVTVHLDLSGDGKRTDYDSKPESGMKLRDFAFIQATGQDWRQVNGSTDRWVSTVKFDALPGDTRFGLSPWYSYSDFLELINLLPQHPHLEKKLIGRSDAGREHWELTITDPAVPADSKQKIFWHAREHAYESYSSFAMEGLIPILLSDEAAHFRRSYQIALHPMTNVDGVAQGYEYRGGYDFPDPRKTLTGRLTFQAIDRLQPDFAVAWHNWIAPRDRNVVFYTDGEDGQATDRAWLRFTQLFPSLRGAGHRWKDEATPLRYNWFQRPSLSDSNLHQYAMKTYGTRIWGWEMPWWNFSASDARAHGAQFAKALLTTLDEIQAGTVPPPKQQPTVEIPRWEPHEFSVQAHALVENLFRHASLVGEFQSPSGKTKVVDGFFDGDQTWRLRFAPDEEGNWTYRLRGEGIEVFEQGTLRCTSARGHGFVRIHPANPYTFAYSDGTPFFPMGDTCYGLFDDSPITVALRTQYLQMRRGQEFNFVRLSVGHSPYRAAAEPKRYWAWGGTPDKPDLDRLNPEFFQAFDELLREMQTHGMLAELLVLNQYRQPFTNPSVWTADRERLWIRYLMARYASFPNVLLWNVSNEYELHPDGKYRLDNPADPDWARSTARWIKANDPYGHPVTVHPVVSASAKSDNPNGPFDPPWRIGEFFGSTDSIDVLSQQTGQKGAEIIWNNELQCWEGDDPNLVASLRADRRFRKPVLNTENGYEYLRGHPTEKRQVHHTDKVRRSSWRIVCAGGYFAAGFNGTIGHSDIWNRIDAPNHYTFSLKDEGAPAQLAFLYRFFTALRYWELEPFDGVDGKAAVALADPGNVYVIYLPAGGDVKIDLRGIEPTLKGRWYNPRTGKFGEEFPVAGGQRPVVSAPDEHDWTLLIRE